MTLDERTVMCTRCPTPCQACRTGGIGPYCTLTPCPCMCHGGRFVDVPVAVTPALVRVELSATTRPLRVEFGLGCFDAAGRPAARGVRLCETCKGFGRAS